MSAAIVMAYEVLLYSSRDYFFLQFVSASQPVTAVAYIFDGLHYGVSDFSYAAYSMVSYLTKFDTC